MDALLNWFSEGTMSFPRRLRSRYKFCLSFIGHHLYLRWSLAIFCKKDIIASLVPWSIRLSIPAVLQTFRGPFNMLIALQRRQQQQQQQQGWMDLKDKMKIERGWKRWRWKEMPALLCSALLCSALCLPFLHSNWYLWCDLILCMLEDCVFFVIKEERKRKKKIGLYCCVFVCPRYTYASSPSVIEVYHYNYWRLGTAKKPLCFCVIPVWFGENVTALL